MTTLTIFGCGYSGRAIARAALERGAKVFGTTRSADKADALAGEGIVPLIFDGEPTMTGGAALRDALAATTVLVVSIAPDHGMREGAGSAGPVDPVLAAFPDLLETMPALGWIGYLSTVGVYGDHDGAWIDEDAECRPTSRRSIMRIEAERLWQDAAAASDVPLAILRLSGIYGPGRNGLVNLAQGTAKRIVKPGQVFNRIHVDDIAGATLHLAGRAAGGVFNVTDDEPAPPQDVVAHAASLMGVAPPPETAFDETAMTPMARSFYGENKRVSNARLKATGYRMARPDYRSALAEMWADGSWRGGEGGRDARSPIRP